MRTRLDLMRPESSSGASYPSGSDARHIGPDRRAFDPLHDPVAAADANCGYGGHSRGDVSTHRCLPRGPPRWIIRHGAAFISYRPGRTPRHAPNRLRR